MTSRNAWPKRISFRTGGLITGVLGILIQPWNLYNDPHAYIFTWLGTYGGATGAIAGVLIADYWWIRRTDLKLTDLYKAKGIYTYVRGWNWKAVVALLVGIVFAIGGSYTPAGASGPFPANGIIPFLKDPFPFADYSWVVGLVVSFLLYGVLTKYVGSKSVPSRLRQPSRPDPGIPNRLRRRTRGRLQAAPLQHREAPPSWRGLLAVAWVTPLRPLARRPNRLPGPRRQTRTADDHHPTTLEARRSGCP